LPVSRVAVALPVPLDKAFHYSIPEFLRERAAVGHVVSAPFGRRTLAGVVTELDPETRDSLKLKSVGELLLDEPVLDEAGLRFLGWVARYYRHPLGQVLFTALPPFVKRQRDDDGQLVPTAHRPPSVEVARLRVGITEALSAFARPGPVRDRVIEYLDRFGEVEVPHLVSQFGGARRVLKQLCDRDLVELERRDRPAELPPAEPGAEGAADPPPDLTDEQAVVLEQTLAALQAGTFSAHLLHGVTGSGKTEVYLRAADRVLRDGGGVLVLVPEIALTPQLVERFASRLGVPLAVLHSGLTVAQRLQRWRALADGSVRVAIGARSTVFAPVQDLRLIVVDEEHDGSYKQEDGLRYHARDVAVMRASLLGAVCVLGSATPSLESLHNADSDKYGVLTLTRRVHERPMPDLTVVDLREEGGPEEAHRLLTPPLIGAVAETVQRGEQAILLLNRRGLSTMVVCGSCGGSFRCDDCDASLTYHGRRHRLLCHYCGRVRHMPERCPSCNDAALEFVGQGTERIEEGLAQLVPGVRVDRMDRDTTTDRGAHERILERFRRGEIQVLVGTQMVAKGHDFPKVTLVGVLHADAALHLPDFRAGERTFALLTQVAGRAGRAELPGRVIVQTFAPDHEAIRFALQHDYEGYARRLMRARRALGYPPYGRLAMVRMSHGREGVVRSAARAAGDVLRQVVRQRGGRQAGLRLLGPSPAPLGRIAGRYRWRLLLLAPDPRALASIFDETEADLRRAASPRGLRMAIDVDPQSML